MLTTFERCKLPSHGTGVLHTLPVEFGSSLFHFCYTLRQDVHEFSETVSYCRKNIYLQAYDETVIRDVMIFMKPNKERPDETNQTRWEVTARVYLENAATAPSNLTLSFSIELKGNNLVGITLPIQNKGADSHNITLSLPVSFVNSKT